MSFPCRLRQYINIKIPIFLDFDYILGNFAAYGIENYFEDLRPFGENSIIHVKLCLILFHLIGPRLRLEPGGQNGALRRLPRRWAADQPEQR